MSPALSRPFPSRAALALLLAPLLAPAGPLLAGPLGAPPPQPSPAAPVQVAVASSLLPAARELARRFAARTGRPVALSAGSTGQLRARILHGAPYALLLAADAETPRLLVAAGRAVPGSMRPLARGRLVLWTAEPRRDPLALLRRGGVRLAVADPRLAPYGRAAREALPRLGPGAGLRLLRAPSAGQALLWAAAGGAELALVGAGQVAGRGRAWPVPARWHRPIRYTAVLLRPGAARPGPRAFLAFLSGPQGRRVLARWGYGPPAGDGGALAGGGGDPRG